MTDKRTLKALLQQAAEQSCDCPRRAGHDVDCQYWQEGVAEAIVRRAAEVALLAADNEEQGTRYVRAILADAGLDEEDRGE